MLVWRLVILLKCLPEKIWVLHTKNEQKKLVKELKERYKEIESNQKKSNC